MEGEKWKGWGKIEGMGAKGKDGKKRKGLEGFERMGLK